MLLAVAVTVSVIAAAGIIVDGEDPAPPPPAVSGSAGSNSFLIDSAQKSEASQGSTDGPQAATAAEPAILIGDFACDSAQPIRDSGQPSSSVTYCSSSEVDLPAITAADVQRAFAELKLPAGALAIQPPDGLTLVNFKTNFYTTSTTPISTSLTLLGQQVTLEATPASFAWNFGDGQSTSTTEPGAPYPDLTITHSYLRKGDYLPSLSTTYTGRYRIATGPWQTIPGTVTIDGPGQPLRAVEAQPKLVGY
ncbi:hypothetical protein KVF89_03275 [Nocardioides carbamazepini]|uniref:PKD domain-containing protein n=1 Tax=Nocardioides carbamazepini TaxID=2854259 RepID=UPI002149A972|nr:hypothetical protein [Nocardioides carbamazepini]MCR1781544.1 hypothetical protein [Nocardioides carbamazepini]